MLEGEMYFIHAKYVVVLIISRARIFRSENKMSEKNPFNKKIIDK